MSLLIEGDNFYGFNGINSGSQVGFLTLNQHGKFFVQNKKKGTFRSTLYSKYLILKFVSQKAFKGSFFFFFNNF